MLIWVCLKNKTKQKKQVEKASGRSFFYVRLTSYFGTFFQIHIITFTQTYAIIIT